MNNKFAWILLIVLGLAFLIGIPFLWSGRTRNRNLLWHDGTRHDGTQHNGRFGLCGYLGIPGDGIHVVGSNRWIGADCFGCCVSNPGDLEK